MNLFFIIGGIAVIAGITYMTIAYFKTAKELEDAKSKIRFLKRELTICADDYDFTSYELASEEDLKGLKFGEF